jgi:alpha-L-fucosidase
VVVSDDGYFELTKPPSVDGVIDESESESGPETKMAEAMAATVEQAMELKSDDGGDDENKK